MWKAETVISGSNLRASRWWLNLHLLRRGMETAASGKMSVAVTELEGPVPKVSWCCPWGGQPRSASFQEKGKGWARRSPENPGESEGNVLMRLSGHTLKELTQKIRLYVGKILTLV